MTTPGVSVRVTSLHNNSYIHRVSAASSPHQSRPNASNFTAEEVLRAVRTTAEEVLRAAGVSSASSPHQSPPNASNFTTEEVATKPDTSEDHTLFMWIAAFGGLALTCVGCGTYIGCLSMRKRQFDAKYGRKACEATEGEPGVPLGSNESDGGNVASSNIASDETPVDVSSAQWHAENQV